MKNLKEKITNIFYTILIIILILPIIYAMLRPFINMYKTYKESSYIHEQEEIEREIHNDQNNYLEKIDMEENISIIRSYLENDEDTTLEDAQDAIFEIEEYYYTIRDAYEYYRYISE